jgi:sigma-B regulation protein RsbU (phosphoserine phosphatase)
LIANAGHPKPLLDGRPVEIKGLPLGINPRGSYREERVFLDAGSTLVAYSDGLEDVESESGEQFGPDRVEAFFREHSHLAPDEARTRLQATLAAFAGRAMPADDQTYTILQRTGQMPPAASRSATRPLANPGFVDTNPLQA